MKKYTHIFNGDKWFNLIPLFRGIREMERQLSFSIGEKIVFCSSNADASHYDDFMSEFGLRIVIVGRGRFRRVKMALALLKNWFPCRLVFHGYIGMSRFFALNPFAYVCLHTWTLGEKVIHGNREYIQKLFNPYKRVYALITPDLDVLRNAGVLNANLLPYPGGPSVGMAGSTRISDTDKAQKLKIVLGNSCWSIDGYLELLPALSKHRNKISQVVSIVSYGNVEQHRAKIEILRSEGARLFGKCFILCNRLMPLDDYYDFLSEFDVYISPNQLQGGLGIIFLFLGRGKTVYLNGMNYEFAVNEGYNVFRCEEISASKSLRVIGVDEAMMNINKITEKRSEVHRLWLQEYKVR